MNRTTRQIAIFAAALGACLAGVAGADEPPQIALPFDCTIGGVNLDSQYLLYLPEGYESGDDVPVMFFFHGAGERGSNINVLKNNGPPMLIEQGKDFPCVVVSLQCPADVWWRTDHILLFMDHVLDTYTVDTDRIYVTGLSMGGFASWALGGARNDIPAALVPICGGGDPADGPALAEIPIWAFHGDADTTVPLWRSEQMVNAAIRAGGTDVQLTIYPGVGHNSWTPAYNDPAMWEWMFTRTNGLPAIPGDSNDDGAVTDADYTVWADHYGQTHTSWLQGDCDMSTIVTDGDYTIWADHYGQSLALSPVEGAADPVVPEPAALSLLAAGICVVRLRRRR
jgi:poly(3-hydroxybutyrate) depolymerase